MSRSASPGSGHLWKFFRVGGLDQAALESGADLRALGELDPKLWVALSCPVRGLEIDEKTLALIDADGDGHIRVPDLIDAVRWAAARLKDAGDLLKGGETLPLAAIDEASPEGAVALAAARRILGRLGRADADAIAPADTGDPARVFGTGSVAGDGVIPPEAAPDAATRALIDDIVACLGADTGRIGRSGATAIKAALFLADAEGLVAASLDLPTFLPYPGWNPPPPASPVAQLGLSRLREILASPARARLDALFAQDAALAPEWEALAAVDRLARYHRDLRTLLRNFVNFFDFYSRDRPAAFQAGKLYLDSRACHLCIRVEDPAAHSILAAMSKAYVAYLDCRRPGGEKMKIAACFTQGDSDYLFVGRNGVFYDRQGRDWDAVITLIIDNPISVRQGFFSPYKKLLRSIEEQMVKRAAAAGGPARPKFDVGTVAALGVAVGGLTTGLGLVLSRVSEHRGWIPLSLLGLICVISGPSVLIAWFKLRQRNLGPLLEANGWAVNGRVKINAPLGAALTERAALPPGAKRRLNDPYADRAAAMRRGLIVALLLLAGSLLVAARILHLWPFGP